MKTKYIFAGVSMYFLGIINVFASTPRPNCDGLPGCSDGSNTITFSVIGNLTATVIQYVAVIAVLAVMYGGILYLLSSGDDEKIKKAKNVIIWALVGVFVSVTAWTMINILNNFRL
ncbi:pilin [Candidatus Gracilibacteria bacterium]|nr:pilin [Candidatus Gracilibacteria bacterium]